MSEPPAEQGSSGKRLILIMLGLCVALSVFGWWWNYREAEPPQRLWGTDHALRIRDASKVEVLKLVRLEDLPVDPTKGLPAESFLLKDTWYAVAQSVDGSQVLGVNDFRRVLLAKFGYDWEAKLDDCQPRWDFALRLIDKQAGQTTLLYASNCQQMFLLESGVQASISPSASFAESYFKRSLKLE